MKILGPNTVHRFLLRDDICDVIANHDKNIPALEPRYAGTEVEFIEINADNRYNVKTFDGDIVEIPRYSFKPQERKFIDGRVVCRDRWFECPLDAGYYWYKDHPTAPDGYWTFPKWRVIEIDKNESWYDSYWEEGAKEPTRGLCMYRDWYIYVMGNDDGPGDWHIHRFLNHGTLIKIEQPTFADMIENHK